MRILLVEDEPSAATMLAKGLREEAYAVDIAADGETALAQAFVNDYDRASDSGRTNTTTVAHR